MSILLFAYLFWLAVTFIIVLVIVPRYVPDEYKEITVHITTLGFVLISLLSKFIVKLYDGSLTYMFMILFLFSIAVFATLISGVYYWMPHYLPDVEISLVTNIILGGFTTSLIFINLYDQEYQDTIYKAGDIISMIAGKRRIKK